MKDKKTLNLISLGCAKNLVDSEILLGGLDKTNVSITKDPEKADTIVVNTCGFLDIAREESVDTILQAAEMKRTGSLKELVVMGCLSERYPQELKKEIKETMEYKELQALERQKEWTNEKLIKASGIGKIGGKQE